MERRSGSVSPNRGGRSAARGQDVVDEELVVLYATPETVADLRGSPGSTSFAFLLDDTGPLADSLARLALAVSTDLIHWEKQGVLFPQPTIEPARPEWSKSGAVAPKQVNGEYKVKHADMRRLVAEIKVVEHEADLLTHDIITRSEGDEAAARRAESRLRLCPSPGPCHVPDLVAAGLAHLRAIAFDLALDPGAGEARGGDHIVGRLLAAPVL